MVAEARKHPIYKVLMTCPRSGTGSRGAGHACGGRPIALPDAPAILVLLWPRSANPFVGRVREEIAQNG